MLPQTAIRPGRAFLASIGFGLMLAIACSSSPSAGNDPPGFECEYHPAGSGPISSPAPTPEQLGEFDAFFHATVTGHTDDGEMAGLVNRVEVKDPVAGGLAESDATELYSDFRLCLETGREYFVIADTRAGGQFFDVPHPWASFPVINNRITLHPDMRKDELIGEFHGLDPVLFKRRFVELVDRSDIEVD